MLAEVLVADNTIGKTFEVFEGDTPIADAVRAPPALRAWLRGPTA